ncbi:hypothetical protein T4B_3975 [Trichinella pseudospiralis]|uniref:Uncharacterized protein n=1 Tax=Trichinella pseudospiralis TaxID=6337 RepID=A0A0V1J2L2_TRIPS|nr:hypothetical protein T4A_5870 [Trichinella pseudospiralis]KRZ08684.1 hypothetical protein T4B_3975 [Trichinella pseudospiralis]KRZ28869.1 hypothetical protein T4C_6387 [Trichinella pseudospiralis]
MIPVTPKKQSRKEHQRFIRVEINLNFSYKHFVILLITDSQLESATSSPDDGGTPSITAGSNSRNFFVGRVISPFAIFNRTNLTTPSLPWNSSNTRPIIQRPLFKSSSAIKTTSPAFGSVPSPRHFD